MKDCFKTKCFVCVNQRVKGIYSNAIVIVVVFLFYNRERQYTKVWPISTNCCYMICHYASSYNKPLETCHELTYNRPIKTSKLYQTPLRHMVYSIFIYSIQKCLLYTKVRFWPFWYTERDPKQQFDTRIYGRNYTKVFTVYQGPPPLVVYEGPLIRRSAYTKVRSNILTFCQCYENIFQFHT